MWSASASQAHFRSVHVCPDCAGANLEVVLLMSGSTSSLSIWGRCLSGQRRGLSWKWASTFGGVFAKNLCKRRSATSSWEWTNLLGPLSKGTLVTLWPYLQPPTSQSLAFSWYSSPHLRLSAH